MIVAVGGRSGRGDPPPPPAVGQLRARPGGSCELASARACWRAASAAPRAWFPRSRARSFAASAISIQRIALCSCSLWRASDAARAASAVSARIRNGCLSGNSITSCCGFIVLPVRRSQRKRNPTRETLQRVGNGSMDSAGHPHTMDTRAGRIDGTTSPDGLSRTRERTYGGQSPDTTDLDTLHTLAANRRH
jgi:hypothetical protein